MEKTIVATLERYHHDADGVYVIRVTCTNGMKFASYGYGWQGISRMAAVDEVARIIGAKVEWKMAQTKKCSEIECDHCWTSVPSHMRHTWV